MGRVHEALEAHIWPHCEMKINKSTSTVAHDEVETASALNTDNESKDNANDRHRLISSIASNLPFRHNAVTERTSKTLLDLGRFT
jgi:hypothetical protein